MGRFGEKHVEIGEQLPFDRTPADILLALLELYPDAGECWVDCYQNVDAFAGITNRAELLGDLFDMAHLVGVINDEELAKVRKTFGVVSA